MNEAVNLTPETVISIEGRQYICVDGLVGYLIPVCHGVLVFFPGIMHDISEGVVTSKWVRDE